MAEQRACPRCSEPVSVDAPEGLCPECLYRRVIDEPADGQGAKGEERSPSPAFVPPAPAELAGHFPQLEILELVGQGGMGAVYKARQAKLDRLLAVKILPPEVAREPAFAERFSREARSLARLNHPNIVTIFDFGETNGLFYFSMEFVDGKNVRQLMQSGELTPSQALQIVPQVCEALRYAHDEGVVHRDIKPENILLDKKGRVKIADFGLAKIVGLSPAYLTLTGTHEVMGTLYYMAPEQMKRSHLVDHRADLYSLGVVFYEMLTGELPVGRFAPPSHKARVDGRLDSIVLRALSREPEHRYQDAAELKKDVETVAVPGSAQQGGTSGGMAPGFVPTGFFEAIGRRPWPSPPGVHHPAAVSPGVKPSWPTVRFTIPGPWSGAKAANGEIYRNDQALILEFRQAHWGGLWWSDAKEVRIPLSEIMSISCQTEALPGMPNFPKWLRKWGTMQIVIKVTQPGALAGLPAGKHGRGRLVVHGGDREAAKQLVDSIVRPASPYPSGPLPRGEDPRSLEPMSDLLKIRGRLMGPAIGLILAGILANLSVVGASWYINKSFVEGNSHWGLAFWALPVAVMAAVLLTGAIRMIKLRSYFLAVIAAVLALLPWSPGWVLGLPCGIWALMMLKKPEVMAAFLGDRRGLVPGVPSPQPGHPQGGSKLRSFFRSVGGYLLTRFSERRSFSEVPAGKVAEPPEPLAPTPPLLPTADYTGEPPASERSAERGT